MREKEDVALADAMAALYALSTPLDVTDDKFGKYWRRANDKMLLVAGSTDRGERMKNLTIIDRLMEGLYDRSVSKNDAMEADFNAASDLVDALLERRLAENAAKKS